MARAKPTIVSRLPKNKAKILPPLSGVGAGGLKGGKARAAESRNPPIATFCLGFGRYPLREDAGYADVAKEGLLPHPEPTYKLVIEGHEKEVD